MPCSWLVCDSKNNSGLKYGPLSKKCMSYKGSVTLQGSGCTAWQAHYMKLGCGLCMRALELPFRSVSQQASIALSTMPALFKGVVSCGDL